MFHSKLPNLQNIQHLGPATDFYKKLSLECSGQQIAVDLFMLNSQYADMASVGESSDTFLIYPELSVIWSHRNGIDRQGTCSIEELC